MSHPNGRRPNVLTAASAPACRTAAVAALLCVAAGCGGRGEHYGDWRIGDDHFHAAEGGRVVELRPMSVRTIEGYGMERWYDRLVEQCGRGRRQPRPCWPGEGVKPSPRLLDSVVNDLPAHRRTAALLYAARYRNREVGAGRPAWVIGTHPLAVAFLDERPDAPADSPATALATGGPFREARLVRDADLDNPANAVLLYPTAKAARPRLLSFREPRRVRDLIRELARSPKDLVAAADSAATVGPAGARPRELHPRAPVE